MREKYLSQFLQSCFPLPVTSKYPEIMAFTVPFVPPKRFSFSEDPSPFKFFYDEVTKEEELGRGSLGSTYIITR